MPIFNLVRVRLFLILSVVLYLTIAHVQAVTITTESIVRPEGARQYLLVTPDRFQSEHPPLVILLHGHSGTAEQLLGLKSSAAPLSIWKKIADREGLLLAAPNGEKGSDGKQGWNDCRSDAASNPHTDDVELIRAIIAREVSEHKADPDRIYVMGMSNGGIMVFRLAIELGDKLAAFATVSASMAAKSLCPAPGHPVSALIVSGTADPLIPYTGGEIHFLSSHSRGSVLGVEASVNIWRHIDSLDASPDREDTIPHIDTADETRITKTLWGADPARLQIELLKVDKGGHVEPSLSQRFRSVYTMIVGPQNSDLEVAEEAWQFFKDKHATGPH